jgi:hypothetical protein
MRTTSIIMAQYAPPKRQSSSTRLHGEMSKKNLYSPLWGPEISQFYPTSGCASSDVFVRLESESLSHPHSVDACAAIVIGSMETDMMKLMHDFWNIRKIFVTRRFIVFLRNSRKYERLWIATSLFSGPLVIAVVVQCQQVRKRHGEADIAMLISKQTSQIIHSQALIVQDGPLASFFGVSWSHTYRHTVGFLWTSDQPVAETSTYTGQHNI